MSVDHTPAVGSTQAVDLLRLKLDAYRLELSNVTPLLRFEVIRQVRSLLENGRDKEAQKLVSDTLAKRR